jgi:hypothetical protein
VAGREEVVGAAMLRVEFLDSFASGLGVIGIEALGCRVTKINILRVWEIISLPLCYKVTPHA